MRQYEGHQRDTGNTSGGEPDESLMDDVHRTIFAVDMRGFGLMNRTRSNYVAIRDGMYNCVSEAFERPGISWDRCYHEIKGDGMLVLVPPSVSKRLVAGAVVRALTVAVDAHNQTHEEKEQLAFRVGLHAGEVTFDSRGVTGPAIIHVHRLLDATPLKEAHANSTSTLAVITSDWFYHDVVYHYPDCAPEAYRKIDVNVKETSGTGWIRLPGDDLPVPPLVTVDAEPVPVLPRTAPPFFEVVDALEQIPCMRDEHTRSMVVEQLSFAGMVRYAPSRRAHLTSILRTCANVENGVMELVSAISNLEPEDSIPVRRLAHLLTG